MCRRRSTWDPLSRSTGTSWVPPYLAGTVVGTRRVLKTHSVQSSVRTAGLCQTRELLLQFNLGVGVGDS